MDARDGGADAEAQAEPQRDVDHDAGQRGDRRVNALPLQVLADDRADDFLVEDFELANVGGAKRGLDELGPRLEAGALLGARHERQPDEDLILVRAAVLLDDQFLDHGLEGAPDDFLAGGLLELQLHDRAAREVDAERQPAALVNRGEAGPDDGQRQHERVPTPPDEVEVPVRENAHGACQAPVRCSVAPNRPAFATE